MTEKDIVNEAINNINSIINFYTSAISQIENIELRSLFIEMNNEAKKSQNNLYRIAKELNYPVPTGQTSQERNTRDHNFHLNTDSTHNYISSQTNGILDHIDVHTNHALQASQSNAHTIRK